ncbi:MAG: hypothetical protein OXC26_15310, partial [Albidovulum sp.]|nr:hypothetical protein [Albidovulum sp.]
MNCVECGYGVGRKIGFKNGAMMRVCGAGALIILTMLAGIAHADDARILRIEAGALVQESETAVTSSERHELLERAHRKLLDIQERFPDQSARLVLYLDGERVSLSSDDVAAMMASAATDEFNVEKQYGETEKNRLADNEYREAHEIALARIATLESTLSAEKISRLEEAERLVARIAALEKSLDEEARLRLAEAATGALLLSDAEATRDEYRDAHAIALARIATLESTLSEERESRFDESERLAARIAVLEKGVDEESRLRLIEVAAREAAQERLEDAESEVERRLVDIESLRERLDAEERRRLSEAAAAALLLGSAEAERDEFRG